MSRIETALKPLIENNSSAAHNIASRAFGLRVAEASLVLAPPTILFILSYKLLGLVNGENGPPPPLMTAGRDPRQRCPWLLVSTGDRGAQVRELCRGVHACPGETSSEAIPSRRDAHSR